MGIDASEGAYGERDPRSVVASTLTVGERKDLSKRPTGAAGGSDTKASLFSIEIREGAKIEAESVYMFKRPYLEAPRAPNLGRGGRKLKPSNS